MTQMYQESTQDLKLQQKMQTLEVQQKYIIMLGADVNEKQVKLSPEAIKKLRKDYINMYIGFVSINWGQGKTLGASWQKAIEQMDAFVASKNKITGHPVNDELTKFHAEHRYLVSKNIMTNKHAGDKLEKRLQQKFIKFGMEDLKKGKAALDATYKQYMPKEKVVDKNQPVKSFEIAKVRTQQLMQQAVMKKIFMLGNQRQHEAA